LKRRKINIRIIAATHRDLYTLVREGAFRDDLYYRLKVFPIQLPPLNQRRDDIPLLVGHFIQKHNKKTAKQILGVSQATLRIFMDYNWPGMSVNWKMPFNMPLSFATGSRSSRMTCRLS